VSHDENGDRSKTLKITEEIADGSARVENRRGVGFALVVVSGFFSSRSNKTTPATGLSMTVSCEKEITNNAT